MVSETKQNFIIFFTLLCFVAAAQGFLDLEELKSIHYEIDILDTPTVLGKTVDSATLTLSSKYGQQYQCSYTTGEEERQHEKQVAIETGIIELLRPMQDGPCLVQVKDWWTYEFCYGRSIKQYHMKDGQIDGDIISLGEYESDFDWENSESESNKRLNRYHTQQYVNGTECDLTGKPRRTEVRFMCEEGHSDLISQIRELETCVYTLTVMTSRICHHPFMRQTSRARAVPITCQPLLSEHDYHIYELQIQAAQKKEEKEIEKQFKELFGEDEDMEADMTKPADQNKKLSRKPVQRLQYSDTQNSYVESEESVFMRTLNEGLEELRVNKDWDLYESEMKHKKKKTKPGAIADDLDDTDIDDADSSILDDEDDDLLDEFHEGLDDITTSPTARQTTQEFKDTMSSFVQSQFQHIIDEAQDEVGVNADNPAAVKSDMSKLLHKLMKEIRDIATDMKEQSNDESTTPRSDPSKASDKSTVKQKPTTKTTDDDDDDDVVDVDEDEAEKEDELERQRDYLHSRMEELLDELEDKLGYKRKNSVIDDTDDVAGEISGIRKFFEYYMSVIDDIEKAETELESIEAEIQELEDLEQDLRDSEEMHRLTALDDDDDEDEEDFLRDAPRVKVSVTSLESLTDKLASKTKPEDGGGDTGSNLPDGDDKDDDTSKSDVKLDSKSRRKLEQKMSSELQKAGLDTGGRQIEVKIIASGVYNEDDDSIYVLSDDETSAFSSMIVKMIGGTSAAVKESERQHKLEQNYGFKWKPPSDVTNTGETSTIDSSNSEATQPTDNDILATDSASSSSSQQQTNTEAKDEL